MGTCGRLSTALHLLCHLVKLSGCSGSAVWLRWMETWGLGRLSGTVPSSPRPLRLISPSSVLYLRCSHHALGSTEKYKEKPSANCLPQFNQDLSHGCLLRKCTRLVSVMATLSRQANEKRRVKMLKMQMPVAFSPQLLNGFPQCF